MKKPNSCKLQGVQILGAVFAHLSFWQHLYQDFFKVAGETNFQGKNLFRETIFDDTKIDILKLIYLAFYPYY